MARIAGVDLPKNKKIEIALTYIYGIGPSNSKEILKKTGVDPNKKVRDLSTEEIGKLQGAIESLKVEGALRMEVARNIKRLVDIGCYRGIRHKIGLPVRGQRTRHNARTRKGPRGNIFRKLKKKEK
ncbi:MAG: 30S ribosomal protein S13 [Candidatus Hydrothermales bacterium]